MDRLGPKCLFSSKKSMGIKSELPCGKPAGYRSAMMEVKSHGYRDFPRQKGIVAC